MVVTLDVSQFSVFDVTPLLSPLLNAIAVKNIEFILVTFEVSQAPMF